MTRSAIQPTPRQRRQPALRAPLGLAHAFKLIAESDWTANAASGHATEIYPHALRFIDSLHEDTEGGGIHRAELIAAATKALHGHCWTDEDITSMPELTGSTALYLGFAVAWLLMSDIRGKWDNPQ